MTYTIKPSLRRFNKIFSQILRASIVFNDLRSSYFFSPSFSDELFPRSGELFFISPINPSEPRLYWGYINVAQELIIISIMLNTLEKMNQFNCNTKIHKAFSVAMEWNSFVLRNIVFVMYRCCIQDLPFQSFNLRGNLWYVCDTRLCERFFSNTRSAFDGTIWNIMIVVIIQWERSLWNIIIDLKWIDCKLLLYIELWLRDC